MSLVDWLLNRNNRLIGLDVGVSGIKAVELYGEERPRLVAYNRVPLPFDTVSPEGEVKDREALVAALKTLFQTTNFSSKKVAIGACGNSVITKKISLPKMPSEELGHQLYWEAEQYLPFPLDAVNLDFAILGSSRQTVSSEKPMMDVLLVAAKKDYVATLSSVIEEAGLQPKVIDIQAFALGNVFEYNYGHRSQNETSSSVIVDFGAGSTKVSIVEGDKTVFTRELRQSGFQCTQVLSEGLGISIEEAETIKIFESQTEAVKKIVDEFTLQLGQELGKTIDFFLGQGSDRLVDGIYICGGASKTRGLLKTLESVLPYPISILDPIQHVSGSGQKMSADAIREISYLGAVAIGLSLRKLGDRP